jgi:hypothetical protein
MDIRELTSKLREIQEGLDAQPALRVSALRCHVSTMAIFVSGLPKEMYMGSPENVLVEVQEAIQAKGEQPAIDADARHPRKVDPYFELAKAEARAAAEGAQMDDEMMDAMEGRR